MASSVRPPFPLGLISFGLLSFVLGAYLSCWQYRRATFPEYPRNMSAQEMLSHRGFAFTRYDRGQLLREQALYRVRGTFQLADPRVGFESASSSEILAAKTRLLRTWVRLSKTPPMLRYFTLIQKKITYRNGVEQHEEVTGYRLFAPAGGSGGALWVVSPFTQTEPKPEPFLTAGAYAGYLVPLRELLAKEDFHKLAQLYGPSVGDSSIPQGAVAIVEGSPPTAEEVDEWYPLGPLHDLFVVVPDDADLDGDYAEGMLDEPLSSSARASLQQALDHRAGAKVTLPPVVRPIVLTTPEAFKKQRGLEARFSRYYLGLLALGVMMLAMAGVRVRRMLA